MKKMKIIPKGILRMYILFLLSKKPLYGYEIIKKIENKTKFWKPSPGTIYPLLHKMVEEKLVKKEVSKRRKVYSLTNKGKLLVKKTEMIRKKLRGEVLSILSQVSGIERKELKKFVEQLKEIRETLPGNVRIRLKVIMGKVIKGIRIGKEKEITQALKLFERKLDKILSNKP